MKIGIVAPEFPPAIGGMEDHAAGLTEAFATNNDVVLYTKNEYANIKFDERYLVRPILTGRVINDVRGLAHERIDRWLTLNAAYSWLSRHTDAPVFAYCHGDDFMKPWTNTLTVLEYAFVNMVRRLPYFWRFHTSTERKLKQRRIIAGLAHSKVVFLNSSHTQGLLATNFPTIKTPTAVSWPGVSDIFFEAPYSKAAAPTSTLRLLTVARLCVKKNVGNILRALATVKGEIDFIYTVIGDGDLQEELQRLAEDLGIERQTRFLGGLSSMEVIANLDVADLHVLPSLYESFGIAYAEAAARGVPTLASRTGGAMDAVVEGTNAIIVDGPEPDQIADGLRRFARMRPLPDREMIRKFAERFRRSVVSAQLRDTVLGPI